MKKIILFNDIESGIIKQIMHTLKKHGKIEEINVIKNNRIALEELARSISLYPSILGQQHLGRGTRSIGTLIESLCKEEEESIIYHMPTKAVLGNGFSIAKINFFTMLLYLSHELQELEDLSVNIKTIISNNVCTLMAEDVFLALIEDKEIPMNIRINAGYLLANIWEHRLDHGVKEFAPILFNFWEAREKLTPAFGTMIGFSEIYQISEKIDPVWLEFFQRENLTDEEADSLGEFVFGLSYEEMIKLRFDMEKTGKTSLNQKQVEEIIGGYRIYPEYKITDPRELIRSFKHRSMNAKFRRRAKKYGPHKTFEEYIMSYLLSISGDININILRNDVQ